MTSSTSLIKMCSDLQRSLLNEVLHEFDKNVLREVAEPVKEVLHEFDKNGLRKVVTALGLRQIRKTYQEFKQDVVHSKVTFNADSYRVEKIVPCPDGQHDIVQYPSCIFISI